MTNFMGKTIGIRKKTGKKNTGFFSDLLHKTGWHIALINNHLSDWTVVIGICIVNKTLFMLIFI